MSSSEKKPGIKHFVIASSFLLVATLGWGLAMSLLGFWTIKYPISWPARVQVDEVSARNISFPEQFGFYHKVIEPETEEQKKNVPTGEIIYRDDMLETLKIGTKLDEMRYPDRQSNWYVARTYEDRRVQEKTQYRYWQMSLVYYTGGEVTVPHVPDICAQAGGATLLDRTVLPLYPPGSETAAPNPDWAKAKLVSLYYQNSKGRFVQYYLFSVNGFPDTSRESVRIKLLDLRKRYVYYSKLQFFPLWSISDKKEADRRACEFAREALPHVLAELPTVQDVKRLNR